MAYLFQASILTGSGGYDVTGPVTASTTVTAVSFHGSGASLTGISADAVDVTGSGQNVDLNLVGTDRYDENGKASLAGGAAKILVFNPSTQALKCSGSISGSGAVTGGSLTARTIDVDSFAANWTNAGRTVADLGSITTVDINAGTVDAVIGGTTPAAGTFTAVIGTSLSSSAALGCGALTARTIDIDSFAANWTNASRTVADLGIVTTVDINGGTVDAVIGGTTPAAGTFTAVIGTSLSSSAALGCGALTARTIDIDSFAANWTNASRTVADLGAVTTVDINGGTVDGISSLTVGSDGSGGDVTFHSDTASDYMMWDSSEEQLKIVGTSGQVALDIDTGNLTVGAYGLTDAGAATIASMAGNWTNAGRTVADLGTITTVDINGGTVDGISSLAVDGDLTLGGADGQDTLTCNAVFALQNGWQINNDLTGSGTGQALQNHCAPLGQGDTFVIVNNGANDATVELPNTTAKGWNSGRIITIKRHANMTADVILSGNAGSTPYLIDGADTTVRLDSPGAAVNLIAYGSSGAGAYWLLY